MVIVIMNIMWILVRVNGTEGTHSYEELGRGGYNVDINIDEGKIVSPKHVGHIKCERNRLATCVWVISSRPLWRWSRGAIIWAKWHSANSCFSVFHYFLQILCLGTTISMLRDILKILMGSTPWEIDVKKVEKGLIDNEGIIVVQELHIWTIAMGKTICTCHVIRFSFTCRYICHSSEWVLRVNFPHKSCYCTNWEEMEESICIMF